MRFLLPRLCIRRFYIAVVMKGSIRRHFSSAPRVALLQPKGFSKYQFREIQQKCFKCALTVTCTPCVSTSIGWAVHGFHEYKINQNVRQQQSASRVTRQVWREILHYMLLRRVGRVLRDPLDSVLSEQRVGQSNFLLRRFCYSNGWRLRREGNNMEAKAKTKRNGDFTTIYIIRGIDRTNIAVLLRCFIPLFLVSAVEMGSGVGLFSVFVGSTLFWHILVNNVNNLFDVLPSGMLTPTVHSMDIT